MVKKPIVKKQELYLSDDCISNCNVPFTPMLELQGLISVSSSG